MRKPKSLQNSQSLIPVGISIGMPSADVSLNITTRFSFFRSFAPTHSRSNLENLPSLNLFSGLTLRKG